MKPKFITFTSSLVAFFFSFTQLLFSCPVTLIEFKPVQFANSCRAAKIVSLDLEIAASASSAQKIDQVLEKSKMNSFVKGLLSTVANAGLSALGGMFVAGAVPGVSVTVPDANGVRGPPTGLAGFFQKISSGVSSIFGGITTALKDAAGFVKSLFISAPLPSNAKITFGPQKEILFDSDGKPAFLRFTGLGEGIAYALEPVEGGIFRADLGEGKFQLFRFDTSTSQILDQTSIDNLNPSAWHEEAWENWSELVTTDPTLQSIGGYAVGLTEGMLEGGWFTLKSFTNPVQSSLDFGVTLANWMSHPVENYLAARSLISSGRDVLFNASNPYESGRALGKMFGGIEILLATGGVVKGAAIPKWNNQLTRDQTVLGHYPDYIKLADKLGARKFSIPEKIWNKMTEAERWEANKKFLDRAIFRGDDVILSNPAQTTRLGSAFANEIKYLLQNGYKVVEKGWKLTRKQWAWF